MFPKFSVRKPFTVLVAVVLVIALGAVAFGNMTPDLLPEIDLPYIIVMTTYVGATPEEVENTVTRPIEQSLATLDYMDSISSTSSENYSIVMMSFTDDADLDYTSLAIREKLTTVSAGWEDTVGTPTILKISPDMLPVSVAAVSYDGMDVIELSEFVEDTLLPKLEGVEGIASVTASGLIENRVEVHIDPEKVQKVNDKLAANVQEKLDDAVKELDDKKAEVEENLQKLKDGQQELADGKDELNKQKQNAAAEISAAKTELDSKKQQLLEGKLQMNTALTELNNQITQLDTSIEALNALKSGIEQAEAGQKQSKAALDSLNEVSTQLATLEAAKAGMIDAAIQAGIPAESAEEYLSTQSEEYRQVLEGLVQIEAGLVGMGMTREGLPTAIEQANAGYEASTEALAKLDATLAGQGMTREELPASLEKLKEGRTAAVNGKKTLEDKLRELESGATALDNAAKELNTQADSASDQMSSALTEIIVNEKTLETTVTQLESALDEIDKGYDQIEESREDALKAADITDTVSMAMVAQLVGAQNFSMPAGYVEDTMVSVNGALDDVDSLENLLLFDLEGVGEVRIQDIAEVQVVNNADESYARINGADGVLLSFSKQSDAATADASENLAKQMERLEDTYEGLHFASLMDQGDYIEQIVGSVLENLILGAALAIIILIFFLKDIRPTFVVACSIPLSVMLAIVLMYFSGVTLNIISLSGLAVGVGMLVDNSIVVIENIYRLRNKGIEPAKAAVRGAGQVTAAIVSSTLTTVCVFLPIIFVQGLTRQIFTDMALTITYSLAASLIVALTLVPCMAAGTLKKVRPESRGYTRFLDFYERVIRWSLKYKWAVLCTALALLIVSGIWALSRGFQYMPDMESTQVMVSLEMPEGSTLDDTAKVSDEAVERILEIDGVDTVGAMVSSGLAGMFGISGNSASVTSVTMYVLLDEDAHISMNKLAEEIESRTEDLPCEISASSTNQMSGAASALGGSGVQVELYSNDLDELTEEAAKIAAILENVEGIAEVSDGLEDTSPELRVEIDRDEAMKNGLTTAQVYMDLAAALTESAKATTLDNLNADVMVFNTTSLTPDTLADYEVNAKDTDGTAKKIRLGDIAEIVESRSLSSISRSDQRRTLTVSAMLAEGYNITKVANAAENALKKDYSAPRGFTYEFSGENETINEALKDLVGMLALGILIVYLIMVAQFQSLLSPLIVMFAIPLAFTGGLFALAIFGFEVSVVAMIGFIILVGVIVNNGIVLVDCVNQLREAGMERSEAVVEAGRMRLRPVLMTALTTILGLLPMALGVGLGVTLVQPVAVAGIGGLLYATAMTLIVVPVLYDGLHKRPLKRVDLTGLDETDDSEFTM